MSKNKLPNPMTADELYSANRQFADAILGENVLGGVLIGGAAIEQGLLSLLSHFFVKHDVSASLFSFDSGPLAGLMDRAKVAFSLGLVTELCFSDIKFLARIRNHFAHKHGHPSFDDAEVIDFCRKLRIPDVIVDKTKRDSAAQRAASHMRSRFTMSVLFVSQSLIERTRKAIRRTIPSGNW